MPVKEERHDDAEINDLARKIKEANKAKMAQTAGMPANPMAAGGPVAMARPGQPAIQQFFNGGSAASNGTTPAGKPADPPQHDKPVDEESKKGKFGWFDIEKVFLPFIFRYTTEKYTSVRMVERRLLNRYLQVLPPEVNSCTCIRSYYITDAESS